MLIGDPCLLWRSRAIGDLHQDRLAAHILPLIIAVVAGAEIQKLQLNSLQRRRGNMAARPALQGHCFRLKHLYKRADGVRIICCIFSNFRLESKRAELLNNPFRRSAIVSHTGNTAREMLRHVI